MSFHDRIRLLGLFPSRDIVFTVHGNVNPYLCMYLIVFTFFLKNLGFFNIYIFLSLVSFYDYLFIHCIVTRTYIICILHGIVRINN